MIWGRFTVGKQDWLLSILTWYPPEVLTKWCSGYLTHSGFIWGRGRKRSEIWGGLLKYPKVLERVGGFSFQWNGKWNEILIRHVLDGKYKVLCSKWLLSWCVMWYGLSKKMPFNENLVFHCGEWRPWFVNLLLLLLLYRTIFHPSNVIEYKLPNYQLNSSLLCQFLPIF